MGGDATEHAARDWGASAVGSLATRRLLRLEVSARLEHGVEGEFGLAVAVKQKRASAPHLIEPGIGIGHTPKRDHFDCAVVLEEGVEQNAVFVGYFLFRPADLSTAGYPLVYVRALVTLSAQGAVDIQFGNVEGQPADGARPLRRPSR